MGFGKPGLTAGAIGPRLAQNSLNEGGIGMRGKLTVMVLIGVVLVSVWGLTPGLAGGGGAGGLYIDVDPAHPAYSAIRYLVEAGVLKVAETGGEFRGDQALLRYDAALWLYRAMQRLAEAQAGTDLTALENRLGGVEAQVQSLRADLAASSGQLGSLKSQVSSLQAEVQALKSQAPAGNLARKVQTNFLLSITGVLLGVAAVAMAIFW